MITKKLRRFMDTLKLTDVNIIVDNSELSLMSKQTDFTFKYVDGDNYILPCEIYINKNIIKCVDDLPYKIAGYYSDTILCDTQFCLLSGHKKFKESTEKKIKVIIVGKL